MDAVDSAAGPSEDHDQWVALQPADSRQRGPGPPPATVTDTPVVRCVLQQGPEPMVNGGIDPDVVAHCEPKGHVEGKESPGCPGVELSLVRCVDPAPSRALRIAVTEVRMDPKGWEERGDG